MRYFNNVTKLVLTRFSILPFFLGVVSKIINNVHVRVQPSGRRFGINYRLRHPKFNPHYKLLNIRF